MPKLFAVVTFPEEQDKVAVVPISWLTEDRAQCHWLPKRRGVRVEELVRDRVDPTAAWQTYPVCLVAHCSNEDHNELEGGSSPVVGWPEPHKNNPYSFLAEPWVTHHHPCQVPSSRATGRADFNHQCWESPVYNPPRLRTTSTIKRGPWLFLHPEPSPLRPIEFW
ncbi:hypothetical protein MRX96_048170 [Rhipicephalus microplus]